MGGGCQSPLDVSMQIPCDGGFLHFRNGIFFLDCSFPRLVLKSSFFETISKCSLRSYIARWCVLIV